jgi:sugar phosphate isomerase/epimerase
MNISLACSDFSFPTLEHPKVLDLIKLLDIDAVDIGLVEGQSHHWPTRTFGSTAKHAQAVAQGLRDRGLVAADAFLEPADFTGDSLNHPLAATREKIRDWFRHTLDFAEIIGSRHITTLPGPYHEGEDSAVSLGRACDELAWRVEQAAQRGLVLGIEPHDGSVASTVDMALELVRRVPGLTFSLDYTHFAARGIADSTVEPLLDYTSHFHVRGAKEGWIQASLANNVIDYAAILRQLHARGYTGYIEIEYVLPAWPGIEPVDLVSHILLWRDYLRQTAAEISAPQA